MCGGGYGIFRLAAFGEEDFCGGDRLADVALGVVGNVNEKAAERGWQRFLADGADLLEVRFFYSPGCHKTETIRSAGS